MPRLSANVAGLGSRPSRGRRAAGYSEGLVALEPAGIEDRLLTDEIGDPCLPDSPAVGLDPVEPDELRIWPSRGRSSGYGSGAEPWDAGEGVSRLLMRNGPTTGDSAGGRLAELRNSSPSGSP